MSVADVGPVGPSHPVRIRAASQADGVPVLEIPPGVDFATLRDWLRARLPEEIEAIGGGTVRLDLGVRPIQLFDLRRLVNLLRDDFSIEVTGLYVESNEVWAYAERELKLRLFEREEPPELDLDAPEPQPVAADLEDEPTTSDSADDTPSDEASNNTTSPATDDQAVTIEPDDITEIAEIAPDDHTEVALATVQQAPPAVSEPPTARRVPGPRIETPDNDPLDDLLGRSEAAGTRVHHAHRTLRSGVSIRFDGDVIVFGDVNPGAQIIATGNVLVLGSLRGLVHAGASGDESALILGFDLRPTQLRIGRKIAISPNEDAPSGVDPTVARVRDGKIVLEPYRTRSTR